ncbi:MAG: peptidase M23 [Micromonosporaceae bacterium]
MHVSAFVRKLAAVAVFGLTASLPAAMPGHASPMGAGSPEEAVVEKLLNRAAETKQFADSVAKDTKVDVSRENGNWAFGTAVLLGSKDTYPEGWLFLAQRKAGGWQVAFDGEPGFGKLSKNAPVVSPRERQLFASHAGGVTPQANGDYRTGMRLPYAIGQSWYMYGGPHGWGGNHTPYSSVDLAGGDQRVLAARGGTAYTMCTGWIRIIHDRGYATDYYHLWNNISVNGAGVGEGAFLGNTGTDVTCGGSASGRHVHFALRQNDTYVGIHAHVIGKWVIMNGGAAYQGYALHGSQQVNAGGALYNYGALGFTQGIVDAYGSASVNKRSGPGTGYGIVGSVADGATVGISCSANGTTHTGRWGATSLWNRLTDGTWVSDAFLYTGIDGPVNGWC